MGLPPKPDWSGCVARELASALRTMGRSTALVRQSDSVSVSASGEYAADLVSRDSVQQVARAIRERQGRVGGLIHLLPLGTDAAGDAREVRSLFTLTSVFGEELRRSSGVVLTASPLHGRSSSNGSAADFRPGTAGMTGFLRSLAHEWPEVRTRAVHLDLQGSRDLVLGRLLSDVAAGGSEIEIAYADEKRVGFKHLQSELDLTMPHQVDLDEDAVILVTGGARGITAMLAEALAARYRCRLVLVGRSPLPEHRSSKQAAGAGSTGRVRAAARALRGATNHARCGSLRGHFDRRALVRAYLTSCASKTSLVRFFFPLASVVTLPISYGPRPWQSEFDTGRAVTIPEE
ncbi:MAG TPA: hypothetical protein VM534_10865 [Thermoanaerobaculia bacterium]|nr:hypothetical protein [Thermoanaerobaculia bacterium]